MIFETVQTKQPEIIEAEKLLAVYNEKSSQGLLPSSLTREGAVKISGLIGRQASEQKLSIEQQRAERDRRFNEDMAERKRIREAAEAEQGSHEAAVTSQSALNKLSDKLRELKDKVSVLAKNLGMLKEKLGGVQTLKEDGFSATTRRAAVRPTAVLVR